MPDHITPLAKGGSDDDTNIRCLCKACHDEVTAEQFGHRQAGLGAVDAAGMPTNPAHPWNRSSGGLATGATKPAERIAVAQITRPATLKAALLDPRRSRQKAI